jgi:CRP-like cAMP-binding protein
MALIEIAPRSASVRAVEPLVTLVLTAKDLHELRKTHPDAYTLIVMNLARELSRRLRRLDRALAEARRPGRVTTG